MAARRTGLPALPVIKKPSSLHKALMKAYTQLSALNAEFEELALAKEALQHRQSLLAGSCAASALAVQYLKTAQDIDTRQTTSGSYNEQGQQLAAMLEALLPEENLRFNVWRPDGPSRGCAQPFLQGALHVVDIDGRRSHATLLDGGPLSLLTTGLLCLNYDPELRELVQHVGRRPQLATRSRHMEEKLHSDTSAIAAALGNSGVIEPLRCELLIGLAARVLHDIAVVLGVHLLDPLLVYSIRGTCNAEEVQAQLPPPAHLDAAIDLLSLTDEQVAGLLSGLRTFQALQQPLDKRELAIKKRIQCLMQRGCELAAATAAGGCGWHEAAAVPAAAAGDSGAAGIDGGSTSAADSASAGFKGDAPVGSGAGMADPVPQQDSTENGSGFHELMSLVGQLKAVQLQLTWLDTCTWTFVAGQLTWPQVAKYIHAMRPYQPVFLALGRRLATRGSLGDIRRGHG